MAKRRHEDNRIVDNRGARKTIHVSTRKRRIKPQVVNAMIGVFVVLIFAACAVAAVYFFKNRPVEEAVSENEVLPDNQIYIGMEPDTNELQEDSADAALDDNQEEKEELPAEDAFLTNVTPTSFEINWDGMTNDSYLVCYTPVGTGSEAHGKQYREDKSMAMDEICTAYNEADEDFYLTRVVSVNNAVVTGLKPDTQYDVMVINEEDGAIVSENTVRTTLTGYCDPFKAVDSIFTFSLRDESTGSIIEKIDNKTVVMSSETGCQDTECRTMMETTIYSEPTLSGSSGSFPSSVKVVIVPDEAGNYCYLCSDGNYAVHVIDDNGVSGWVNARRLMVDAKKMFTPYNNIYGIQINRTNAYSSIFTTGGDANNVDGNPDGTTRFNAIASSEFASFMNTDGYNYIEGITGEILPNYGSAEQMPVVWDLALELIQCQKNALENGYTILMYEGYRPASTSAAVEGNLSNLGYLAIPFNNTNLAQGFLTDQKYGVSFYIAKRSRHNKGVATDLTIMGFNSPDELGDEIRMQTKMHTLDFRCNMCYNNWQADLLTDIMIGHGSNLEYLAVRSEWWHFQLKTDRTDLYPLISEYKYMDFVF